MGSERAGEGSCTEDAYMAHATAAVLTGVLHHSFEDVAVVETELHMSLYTLLYFRRWRWRLLPCLRFQCFPILWVE